MYKLIAIDLDGTLLDSYGEVSKENKQAIQKAKEQGSIIVIASGRMPQAIYSLAKEIGADEYTICGNGTLIYDFKQDKAIYDAFMEKEKVLQIIQICEENSIYYNVYTENEVLTKSLNYNALYYDNENNNKPEEKRTNIHLVDDVYSYLKEKEKIQILKMTICDSDKIIFSSIIKKLKNIPKIDVLEVEHMARKNIKQGTSTIPMEYYYTEIAKENSNKWAALSFLMQVLQIPKEEVMAIGDNVNDKEMVQNAGLGVAMGNSMLSANQIGDVFVASNNENGVAQAILQYAIL